MIECNIYKNTNADSKYYGKWYPRNEPKGIVDLDGLAQHMAEHNTPFSKGVPRTQSAPLRKVAADIDTGVVLPWRERAVRGSEDYGAGAAVGAVPGLTC